jgi:hypothetical protein
MTKDEALKLALDYIVATNQSSQFWLVPESNLNKTVTAIKEALAQPEQEPVGKFAKFTDGIWREVTDGSAGVLLYTTPQRTWVGLTKEERHEISMANRPYCADVMAAHEEELKRRNT